MEQLKYIVADKTIAYLLGVNNYISDESALLEIVKNSYDAGALSLKIIFDGDSITLIDDGKGMNYEDVKRHWMNVGESDKKEDYDILDANNKKRVLSGSKGVGRFALARLGKKVTITSKTNDDSAVVWTTDWDKSFIKESIENKRVGTKIVIDELNEKWSAKRISFFKDYLCKSYIDDSMKISVECEGEIFHVSSYYEKPKVGDNCLQCISVQYKASQKIIIVDIISDEFQDKAQKLCSEESIRGKKIVLDAFDEISKDKNMKKFELEDIKNALTELGDFNGEFYFNLSGKSSEDDINKFLYKHDFLINSKPGGIGLFRNAFIVTSYDEKKDWLELGKRSRTSPAAASHKTGTWKVRSNQLSGKVLIDKKRNESLTELTNRQGFEENIYYCVFINILLAGIATFERYRQNIVRSIIVEEDQNNDDFLPLINDIINGKRSIDNLSSKEYSKLYKEIVLIQKQKNIISTEKNDNEESYRYDVRILNVLATIGLKASSIAHRLEGKKQSIIANISCVIDSLKEYGVWDELKCIDNSSVKKYQNVPLLLEEQNNINKTFVQFVDTILSKIEKKQFKPSDINIYDEVNNIISKWEMEYSWIKINIVKKNDMNIKLSLDVLQVIFDNLILNSIQQNDSKRNRLNINIEIKRAGDILYIAYRDNGVGLHKKYEKEPRRILDVHETTRTNGHGLGMWIVNNTVTMTGGEISSIKSDGGFIIEFSIGGNL